MTTITELSEQAAKLKCREDALKANISANTKLAVASVIIGVALMAAGILFAGCYLSKIGCNYCYHPCWCFDCNVWAAFIIAVLDEAAALVLLMIYKSNLKQADQYRDELIVLRDLTMALEICLSMDAQQIITTKIIEGGKITELYKNPRIKMQEQIISTLLGRCNN